jgi:hypothetical protein
MKKLIYLTLVAVFVWGGCADNGSEEEQSTVAQVYGTVVANGEPVNAAAILLTPGGGTKITGSDGMYRFSDLQPGRYELKVYKEGFQSFNKSIDLAAGKDEELAITLSASTGKLSLNKAYIDMGSNESNNVAGFSIVNSSDTELAWSITNAAGWISKIEPTNGKVSANGSEAVVFTINRNKLSTNTIDNYATLLVRSTTAGDGSAAELLVTVFGTGDGTNTTIGDSDDDYVVIGDLYVQTKDISSSEINWTSANSLCENSILGGFDDWRLPTIDELATIYTKKEVIGGFTSKTSTGFYWSSTFYGSIFSIMDFYDGSTYTTNDSSNKYSVRAVRKNVLPKVSILPASNISENSVTLNGKLEIAGNPAYTERGFVYGTNHNPTLPGDGKIISYTSKSDSAFSATLNGLTMGASYYVCAYITNSIGTVYSEELPIIVANQMAQVSTLQVSDIMETSAVFHGNIDSKGIPAYTEKGFAYSNVFRNPTIDDNKQPVSGAGIGEFSANISGLTSGAIYYVRAYATNNEGTAYGEAKSFTPNAPNVVVLPVAGLMVQKTDISGNSTVSWSTANSLCENSTLDGYTDWRLPTKNELAVLYNERNTIGGFVQSGSYSSYWSSTFEYETSYADYYWYQSFSNGSQGYGYSAIKARCVRDN